MKLEKLLVLAIITASFNVNAATGEHYFYFMTAQQNTIYYTNPIACPSGKRPISNESTYDMGDLVGSFDKIKDVRKDINAAIQIELTQKRKSFKRNTTYRCS